MAPETFADAGTPFALFEGPLAHAADTLGPGKCWLCGRKGFCLELFVGYDLISPCGACGAMTDFSADGTPERCVSCDAVCRLERPVEGRPACLACLSEGRFAITKDSEIGMVRWRDARSGLSHGLPIPPNADGSPQTTYLELPAEPPNENGWQSIRAGADALGPLVFTPDYVSIQSSVWKFHCGRPMMFVGRWGRRDFERHAPDGDGASFAHRTTELPEDLYAELEDATGEQDFWVGAYVFRCTACSALAGNWDMA